MPRLSVNPTIADASLPHRSRRQREPVARPQPHVVGREHIAQRLEPAGVSGRLHHACVCEAGCEEPLGEQAAGGRRHCEHALQPCRQRRLRLGGLSSCIDHEVAVVVQPAKHALLGLLHEQLAFNPGAVARLPQPAKARGGHKRPLPRGVRPCMGGGEVKAALNADPHPNRGAEYNPCGNFAAPELSRKDDEAHGSERREVAQKLEEADPARHVHSRAVGSCRVMHGSDDHVQRVRGEQHDHELYDHRQCCRHVVGLYQHALVIGEFVRVER
eukprot:scaffold112086_cov66-Phaeocystis_antarctica.AAC.2